MLHDEKYVPSVRRGVIHLSPVPRNMRPTEIQSHFNRFGEIRRMKFVPYPKKERWPGGPLLPLRFREGWMEFNEAANAKRAAETMNGLAVDVKRQRKCHGELWVVKFLGAGFSWDNLIEEKEEKRRLRRATEVQARRTERDANEAYRRLVFASFAQKQKHKQGQSTVREVSDEDEAHGEAALAGTAAPDPTHERPMRKRKRMHKESDHADAVGEEEAIVTSSSARRAPRLGQEGTLPPKAKTPSSTASCTDAKRATAKHTRETSDVREAEHGEKPTPAERARSQRPDEKRKRRKK